MRARVSEILARPKKYLAGPQKHNCLAQPQPHFGGSLSTPRMATNSTKKRKLDSESIESAKRIKISSTSGATQAVKVTRISTDVPVDDAVAKPTTDKGKGKATEQSDHVEEPDVESKRPKHHIIKLVPPRPFPTVPTSVSATGPRSAHKEGKNFICITRKTPLGAYLRRCKNVILVDGCVPVAQPIESTNRRITGIRLYI